jgi:hypothetical protein
MPAAVAATAAAEEEQEESTAADMWLLDYFPVQLCRRNWPG